MFDYAMRLGGALLFRAGRRAASNRQWLAGGATGLRILTFHEIGGRQFSHFRRLIDWCRDRFEVGVPEDCDALIEGRMVPGARDKFLATFDDGLRSHYAAAEWLADQGLRAGFFIVPSWLDRSVGEFLSHHRHHGVTAFEFDPSARSLASSQVREIAAMGHRICAHNDAHRNLAELRTGADLDYEVSRSVEAVERLTGAPCHDFAFAFGQPDNLSDEATQFLLRKCKRVYSCVRGLNVPGRTPRFLLRGQIVFEHPGAFTRLCVEGGADHLMTPRHTWFVDRTGLLPPGRDGAICEARATMQSSEPARSGRQTR